MICGRGRLGRLFDLSSSPGHFQDESLNRNVFADDGM